MLVVRAHTEPVRAQQADPFLRGGTGDAHTVTGAQTMSGGQGNDQRIDRQVIRRDGQGSLLPGVVLARDGHDGLPAMAGGKQRRLLYAGAAQDDPAAFHLQGAVKAEPPRLQQDHAAESVTAKREPAHMIERILDAAGIVSAGGGDAQHIDGRISQQVRNRGVGGPVPAIGIVRNAVAVGVRIVLYPVIRRHGQRFGGRSRQTSGKECNKQKGESGHNGIKCGYTNIKENSYIC